MEQVFQCFGLYMAFLLSSFLQETTIEPPVVFSLKLLWAGHSSNNKHMSLLDVYRA